MGRTLSKDEWAQEHTDNWYYEELSDAKCPCGEPLWGPDWWDGWKDGTEHTVECESCGQEWLVEVEYQEPCVVGLRASG